MADNIGNFTSSQPWTPAVTGAATQSNGVEGNTTSDKDSAVYGVHLGNGIGVFGRGGVNAGEGVFGQTNSGSAGVYGKNSAGGAGIVGESAGGNGVEGNTTSDKDSAVYGVHSGNGIGVFGRGGVNAGEGVFGQTNSGSAGVYGKNSAGGSGIIGESTDGNGVLGFSQNGFAMYADGDVSQGPNNSGFAKALVEISVNGAIATISRHFVNLPGNPLPTLYRLDVGIYSIDFHFNVNKRYVVVTPVALPYTKDNFNTFPENPYAPFWYPSPSGNTYEVNFTVANVVFDGLTGPVTPALGDPAGRVANPTMITVLCYQPALLGAGGANYLTGFQLKDTAISIAIF
jgi:hypothetical protein